MRLVAKIFFLFFVSAFFFNPVFAGITTMNAEKYIGKTIVAGISDYDKNGNLLSSKQVAGKITRISDKRITIQLQNSETKYYLPPDLSALQKATPGIYNLKNGNVKSVVNPDFLAVYDISPKE